MQIDNIEIRRENTRKNCRVYIFPQGETIGEQLITRRHRPHDLYRKQVIPAVLAALQIPQDTSVKWSQTAGCNCGCSPGFIISGVYGRNVFVEVSGNDAKAVH